MSALKRYFESKIERYEQLIADEDKFAGVRYVLVRNGMASAYARLLKRGDEVTSFVLRPLADATVFTDFEEAKAIAEKLNERNLIKITFTVVSMRYALNSLIALSHEAIGTNF